jgi:D-threo-aldose 1-dehydrogenase
LHALCKKQYVLKQRERASLSSPLTQGPCMTFATRAIGPLQVTTLGLGGTGFGGMYTANDRATSMAVIDSALAAGINFVDTAPLYGLGLSERITGDGLRGSTGVVLSTKVGRLLAPGRGDEAARAAWPGGLPFHLVYDYSGDAIRRSVEDSLHRLGLDRIDMLLVHDIGTYTHGADNARHWNDLTDTGYAALDDMRRDGTVRAIGLGVNEVAACQDALAIGRWDAFLLAGRYTLLEQCALDRLLPDCERAGTKIICGGPFNSGILAGGDTWDYAAAPQDIRDRVARLQAVADDHAVPLPALALHFSLGHPSVASVIPGVRDSAQLAQLLDWARLTIPDTVWTDLRDRGLLHPDAPLPQGNPFLTL